MDTILLIDFSTTDVSSIGLRIREIRESTGLGRTLWSRELGIDEKALTKIEQQHQRAREDVIEAVATHYPHYAYWLVTGMTQPEAGNISPKIEELRRAK